jgi:hypothetical protein
VGVKFTNAPVIEDLTPAPDGTNRIFAASAPYAPGSTTVWVNGLRKIANLDDGYVELLPASVQMAEAPWVGDTLQIQYTPAP